MAEKYFGITDVGRERQNNEDNFITEPVLKNKFIAACVIDGVGGYEGGEVAAAIARQTILDNLSVPPGNIFNMMQEALLSANEKIFKEKQNEFANSQMACVLTLALVEKNKNKFYYAHVGDTRLYLFRDQSLVKITKDHSFVGFLEDSGKLDETDAMTHPKRNEINKALGFESQIYNPAEFIETGESPFLPGDLILLCSDGLTDMIDKLKITSILTSTNNLKEKAQELINEANNAGGKDNITVVLVQNDKVALKLKATKPVSAKKNDYLKTNTIKEGEEKNQMSTIPGLPKKNTGLIIFLILLSLISVSGFIWQWIQKNKIEDERKSKISEIVKPHRNNNERRLQDTLYGMAGNTLIISNNLFSDINLTDSLVINNDSIHIKGYGSILITSDSTVEQKAVMIISPSVRYLLFDSLGIQNINIIVNATNSEALHFKDVNFKNVTVFVTNKIKDGFFSGSSKEIQLAEDSIAVK